MTTRNRIGAVLAGAAIVVATLGGSGAVAVAQAEPAAAANDNSRAFNRWVCQTFGWGCPKCYDNWCS